MVWGCCIDGVDWFSPLNGELFSFDILEGCCGVVRGTV